MYSFDQSDWELTLPAGYFCLFYFDNREDSNRYTATFSGTFSGGRFQEYYALYQYYTSGSGRSRNSIKQYNSNETLAELADTYEGEVPLESNLMEFEIAIINLYERKINELYSSKVVLKEVSWWYSVMQFAKAYPIVAFFICILFVCWFITLFGWHRYLKKAWNRLRGQEDSDPEQPGEQVPNSEMEPTGLQESRG